VIAPRSRRLERRWPNSSGVREPTAGSLAGLQLLTAILSLTAGSLDVITYLGLSGLFTAHITGNLVILAAHVAGGGATGLAAMLSVPVFMLMLGVTRILAGGLERFGYDSLRPLLLLQFLFLAAFLSLAVADDFKVDVATAVATIGGMLGVSAMAVQNALIQVSLKGAPGTAVMTTNIARFTMDLGTILLRADRHTMAGALDRANRTWPSIIGFTVGCVLGAVCETRFNLRSLALPTVLSLVALTAAMAADGERKRERPCRDIEVGQPEGDGIASPNSSESAH
jgi:uncharacterized membrane protein YoaK (UPF0700 family)